MLYTFLLSVLFVLLIIADQLLTIFVSTVYLYYIIFDLKALAYRFATLAGFRSEHLTHDFNVMLTSWALLHFCGVYSISSYDCIIQCSVLTLVCIMDDFTSFSVASRTVES